MRIVSIDAGTSVSVRDAAANLVHSMDERGCVTLRTYDELNRLAAVYARDVPDADLSQREQFTYGDQAADHAEALRSRRLGRVWRHLDEAGLTVADSTTSPASSSSRFASLSATRRSPRPSLPDGRPIGLRQEPKQLSTRTATGQHPVRRARAGGPDITAPADAGDRRRHIVPTYGRSGALRSVAIDDGPYVRLVAHNARGQRVLAAYGNGLMTRYAYDDRRSG